MATSVLGAVSHAVANGPSLINPTTTLLLSPESQTEFHQRLLPTLTAQSLVLMEGAYLNQLLRPGHKYYDLLRKEFGSALGDLRPTLGAFDSRFTQNSEKNARVRKRTDDWFNFLSTSTSLGPGKPPTTLDEAIEQINSSVPLVLKRKPTSYERELAQWVGLANRKFDREYIAAIRKFASRFDTCLVVTGAAHSLSLTMQTGLPIVQLFADDPELVLDTYLCYLAFYRWPQVVMEAV